MWLLEKVICWLFKERIESNRNMDLKKMFADQDMTVGPPWRRITEFAVPMLIGNLAQQLYSTVDTIVVGKYVGDLALSAVGSAGPILNLLLALFVGIATGATVIAQAISAVLCYHRVPQGKVES